MEPKEKSVAGYVFGGLSFIPLIGVLFGVIAIIIGVVKKMKGPALLGLSGIIFTVVIYGSLYYFGFVAKTGPFVDLKIQLTEQILTTNAGRISLYERENGMLPKTWDDLGTPSPENQYYSFDPWGTKIQYGPNPDGTFRLRSAGTDKTFETEDDIIANF